MRIEPPEPGEPRRPQGPRDPGDAWVVASDGTRYWGRFGAAGLLALDPGRGVLLQHRVGWSHFGGTWALPGGALHQGESSRRGALREAQEEAGVPDGSVVTRLTHVFDADIWRYTTVVADVVTPFIPRISDPESLELAWFAPEDIELLPLHPGFASSWPLLRSLLGVRPAVLVDAANVVGSVPDGWWRDRAGAATRLRDRLGLLLDGHGFAADDLGLDGDRWYPEVEMIVEGAARGIGSSAAVRVTDAPAAGDDEIVARAAALAAEGRRVTTVTSDRALSQRVEATGSDVRSTSWLRGLLS